MSDVCYHDKKWAVDYDVWHYDSDLSKKQLAEYARKIREALTANGNAGVVSHEWEVIAFWGDDGGDNDRLEKLLDELADYGCYVEKVVPED